MNKTKLLQQKHILTWILTTSNITYSSKDVCSFSTSDKKLFLCDVWKWFTNCLCTSSQWTSDIYQWMFLFNHQFLAFRTSLLWNYSKTRMWDWSHSKTSFGFVIFIIIGKQVVIFKASHKSVENLQLKTNVVQCRLISNLMTLI